MKLHTLRPRQTVPGHYTTAIFIETNEYTFSISQAYFTISTGDTGTRTHIQIQQQYTKGDLRILRRQFRRRWGSTFDMPAGHWLRERCPPCRCTERVGEVLRFVDYRLATKFHDGD